MSDDRTAYQSPTLIIQQEVNELALQKEANKIKQKMNEDWCRSLNHRKQLFWKQVNNAKDRETAHKRDEHQRQKNNTGNAGNRGQSKTSSHMPTTMDSSYTAASSEETVPLKDMAYNKKNQLLSTNTYERKDHRRDHKSSRNKNTTENIPVNRTERCNERRYFHGRNNVCNIYGTTYIGRKCLASFFRRRQTQPRRTLPVLQTLSSTKTVNP